MSLQDDIFDIDELVERSNEYGVSSAWENVIKALNFYELEFDRLRKENYILKSAIKIIEDKSIGE